MRRSRRSLPLLAVTTAFGAVLGILAMTGLARANMPTDQSLLPLLGPSVPRLRFGTGGIAGNRPEMFPNLPAIPGPASPWFVEQWGRDSVLSPERMRTSDPDSNQPGLGAASYRFTAPDGSAALDLYSPVHGNAPVVALSVRDGTLRPGGGSNLFLAVDTPPGGLSLDRALEFRIDAKLASASIAYDNAAAKRTGAVLGLAFAGFVITFPAPQTGRPSTLFLQLPFASSRGHTADYRSCRRAGGALRIVFGGRQAGDPPLPFSTDNGPLRRLSFRISSYLCELLTKPTTCNSPDGSKQTIVLSKVQPNFHDWRLNGMYVGLESENRDLRPQARDQRPQGHVSMTLDVAGPILTESPDASFGLPDCANAR